jgi:tripartite ATP-independent transporter DctP family solute receptor
MVKKLFAVMCLTILTSMVFAGGESEKAPADGKLALKVGTTTAPDGHYVKGLEEFKRLLAEYSGASITLDIYPNSQLGNERDLLEGVSLGTVPMALISTGPFPNFFPDFGVLDLPYLFPTPQIAYKALDGEIGTALLAQLDGKGIKGLGFFENGFRHVTNSKREIKVPADLKGLKIRTMENDIHMNTYQHYGASPTPMAWSEIFTALQQGTVDGQENPTIIIETAKVYEAQKYMSLTGNFYSPCVLIINKALFDKLPKAQQDIVVRAAQEAKVWQRNYSQNYEAEALKKIKSAGTVVTEVDINVWAAASQDTYKDFADKLRQDYIQKIRAAK